MSQRVISDPPRRWLRGRFLGRGSYGSVFVCHDADRDAAPLAVKLFNLGKDMTEADLTGIWDELSVMRSIPAHDKVVQCLGAQYDSGGRLCIFMEFVAGGTLRSMLLARPRLDERMAALCMRQVTDGVAHLHKHKIYHRDLKGENILCVAVPPPDEPLTGVALKLADFGASKRKQDAFTATLSSLADPGRARTGMNTAVGTSLWMAPEVISAATMRQPYNPAKADVWSIGIVCCEALRAGQVPWPKFDNQIQALFHIGQWRGGGDGDELPPEAPRASEVSPECFKFLRRCLAANPQQRAQAAELQQLSWIAEGCSAADCVEAPPEARGEEVVQGVPVSDFERLRELWAESSASSPRHNAQPDMFATQAFTDVDFVSAPPTMGPETIRVTAEDLEPAEDHPLAAEVEDADSWAVGHPTQFVQRSAELTDGTDEYDYDDEEDEEEEAEEDEEDEEEEDEEEEEEEEEEELSEMARVCEPAEVMCQPVPADEPAAGGGGELQPAPTAETDRDEQQEAFEDGGCGEVMPNSDSDSAEAAFLEELDRKEETSSDAVVTVAGTEEVRRLQEEVVRSMSAEAPPQPPRRSHTQPDSGPVNPVLVLPHAYSAKMPPPQRPVAAPPPIPRRPQRAGDTAQAAESAGGKSLRRRRKVTRKPKQERRLHISEVTVGTSSEIYQPASVPSSPSAGRGRPVKTPLSVMTPVVDSPASAPCPAASPLGPLMSPGTRQSSVASDVPPSPRSGGGVGPAKFLQLQQVFALGGVGSGGKQPLPSFKTPPADGRRPAGVQFVDAEAQVARGRGGGPRTPTEESPTHSSPRMSRGSSPTLGRGQRAAAPSPFYGVNTKQLKQVYESGHA